MIEDPHPHKKKCTVYLCLSPPRTYWCWGKDRIRWWGEKGYWLCTSGWLIFEPGSSHVRPWAYLSCSMLILISLILFYLIHCTQNVKLEDGGFKPDLINLFAEMFTCGLKEINCVHVWGGGALWKFVLSSCSLFKNLNFLFASQLQWINLKLVTDIKQDDHKWLSQNDKCGHFVTIMKTLHSFKCSFCNVSVINLILREKKILL